MITPLNEKIIISPKNGWKAHTYYLAYVSLYPTNVVHEAIVYSGFLDDGKPGNYSCIWQGSYDSPEEFKNVHYIKIRRKLYTEGG